MVDGVVTSLIDYCIRDGNSNHLDFVKGAVTLLEMLWLH